MKRTVFLIAAVSFLSFLVAGPSLAAVEQEGGGQVPPDMSQGGSTPGEYDIPPVSPKSLKPAENHPYNKKTVKNPRGETLGTIDYVLEGSEHGKDVYAMLQLEDKSATVPIPLNYLKESETGLILNVTKDQLQSKGGPNLGGRGKSQDFEHHGSEPLNPTTRQGGS